ncbi:MAG: hypothetical protein FJ109_01385 [Deltaproteobacteria bacterium]|nr:hypothetical protein [Deltaproteobacteria bacterium]
MTSSLCWYPPDLPPGTVGSRRQSPDGATISRLAGVLAGRKPALAAIPLDRIVQVLHEASLAWMDIRNPGIRHTLERIARSTGMSMPMVERATVHEMESSLAPDLMAAIRNEIGNPDYLDGFAYNPHSDGMTIAVGPKLVGGIVSSNIPALPHLTVMRSLIVKAPCIVKTSVSEPDFLPAYVQTLHEIDPEVARCVAVVSFGREDEEALQAFLASVDFLIAYGGREAMEALRAKKPARLRALLHGHRLGFALVAGSELRKALEGGGYRSPGSGGSPDRMPGATGTGLRSAVGRYLSAPGGRPAGAGLEQILDAGREALGLVGVGSLELPLALAYDAVLFDQEACLAPHVIFVEGTFDQACGLAERIAGRMERLADDLPPGTRTLAQRLSVRQELDMLALDGRSRVFFAGSIERGIVAVQECEVFRPSPLGRFVRVVPVPDLLRALEHVAPLGDLLQNAAVAAPDDRRPVLERALADLGVCRICPPGNMGTPTMMWHHDGHPCISAMLRFCDAETRGGMHKRLLARRAGAGAAARLKKLIG